MLTAKEQKKPARLEKEMKMHPWKHMFILGIGFGIIVAILTAVLQIISDDLSFKELLKRKLWINLGSAPFIAVFFGYMMRTNRIRQYQLLKEKESLH